MDKPEEYLQAFEDWF